MVISCGESRAPSGTVRRYVVPSSAVVARTVSSWDVAAVCVTAWSVCSCAAPTAIGSGSIGKSGTGGSVGGSTGGAVTRRRVARQLLPSGCSRTRRVASAQPMTHQARTAVDAGIRTLADRVAEVPRRNRGTAVVASRLSVRDQALSGERYHAPVLPGAVRGPRLRTVSPILGALPRTAVAGAATAATTRSGRGFAAEAGDAVGSTTATSVTVIVASAAATAVAAAVVPGVGRDGWWVTRSPGGV